MTREEKIEAFAMRIDGHTYAEIAKKFGVSRQFIQQELNQSLSRRSVRLTDGCIYRNLSIEISKNEMDGKTLCSILYPHAKYSAYRLQRTKGKLRGQLDFTAFEWMQLANHFGKTVDFLMVGYAAPKENGGM